MATLPQPPFWIPRPSDDFIWNQAAVSSATLRILENPKLFGAGGQVVTKHYDVLYTQDDSSYWPGYPLASYIAYANINFKQFRASGQVLQKNWANQIGQQDDAPGWQFIPPNGAADLNARLGPYLEELAEQSFGSQIFYDESPQWQSYSFKSWLAQGIAQQKIYGAVGQVATRNYNPLYTQDDSSTWWPALGSTENKLLPNLTQQKLFGTGGQVVQFKPNFTYDDPAYLVPNQYMILGNNAYQQQFPAATSPRGTVKPVFFAPRPGDNDREFQPQPLASNAISLLTHQSFYGLPGQVPPYRWNYTFDDYSIWTGEPAVVNATLNDFQGPRPHSVYPWSWSDDSSGWQGQSSTSVIQYDLTTQVIKAPLYALTGGDDSSVWNAEPVVNRTVAPATSQATFYGQGGQAPPYQWKWTQDDDTPWSPPVNMVENLQNTVYQAPAQKMGGVILWSPDDPDESALWSGSDVQKSQGGAFQNVLQTPPHPLLNQRPAQYTRNVWHRDDWSEWVGKSSGNSLIRSVTRQTIYGRPGQVPPFRPNFTQDDPPSWQLFPYRNKSVLDIAIVYPPGSTKAFVSLRWPYATFNYDTAESQWQWSITQALPSENYGKPFPPVLAPAQFYQWQTTYDTAESQWLAQSISSYQTTHSSSYPFLSPIYALTGGNDSPPWLQPTQINFSAYGNPAAPPQGPKPLNIYPWQWSDDPSGWQWQPIYPVMQSILTSNFIVPPIVFLTSEGGIQLDSESGLDLTADSFFNTLSSWAQKPTAWFDWVDDPPMWLAVPTVNRALFPPVTYPKFYGLVGQGYPFRPNFGLDDPPAWEPAIFTLSKPTVFTLLQPIQQMPPAVLWSPDDPNDIDVVWSLTMLQASNNAINTVLAAPLVPGVQERPSGYPRGIWRIDDAAEWVGRAIANQAIRYNTVQKIYGQGGQVPPFRPNFTIDDPPMWQGAPGQAQALINLAETILGRLGLGGVPFRILSIGDDPPMWQGSPLQMTFENFAIPIVYPPGTTKAVMATLLWRAAPFNYDSGESSIWSGAPIGQDYGLNPPGPPVPAAVIEFTVSGQGVALVFQEFLSGVSYTDAPIPKRTD